MQIDWSLWCIHCASQDSHALAPHTHSNILYTPTHHNTETRGCPARQPCFVGTAPLCGGWLCDLPNHPDSKKWTRLLNKEKGNDKRHTGTQRRSLNGPTYLPIYIYTYIHTYIIQIKTPFLSSKEDCNGCNLRV
jgi:hypothetical protein